MKKIVILTIAIAFFASSCLPASATDIPVSAVNMEATAAILVQQTLDALPTNTFAPSNTPVISIETATASPSATPTAQAATVTLTTQAASTPTGTLATTTITAAATQAANLVASTTTFTLAPNTGVIETETLHPRFYGTLPPNVAYNSLELVNKSKSEAYISLQTTIVDGSTTILEYPVGGLFAVQVPVGKYKYVAWVGGNKIIGSFVLGNNDDLRITIYKDRVEIKKR